MDFKPSTDDPRVSLQGMRVLEAFMLDVYKEIAGADVARFSRLPSGTLYPILLRFESAGWLSSRWEEIDPKHAGRPRRRLYRLTPTGAVRAQTIFSEFHGLVPV